MSHVICRQLIETRLKAWADIHSPKLIVAWENKSLTPPVGLYLRAFLLPAIVDDEFLSGGHRRYYGVYQVNVCDDVDTGPMPSTVIADELDALFPTTLHLVDGSSTLVVTSPVRTGPILEEKNKSVLPVYFNFQMNKTI